MRSIISKLFLIPLAVLAIGCGGGDEKSIQGSFNLLKDLSDFDGDAPFVGPWDGCSGTGGYGDFGPGMNVTVRDGSGNIVGSGSTESFDSDDLPAEDADEDNLTDFEEAAAQAESFGEAGLACSVKFDVPIKSAEFYEVEIGKRGELSYSDSELKDRDYWISLSLGN